MDEPLYVLGPRGGSAYRVTGPRNGEITPVAGLSHGLAVWPRQDRSFVGYTRSDYTHEAQPFGAEWTIVTYPELTACRLLGRITKVVGDLP